MLNRADRGGRRKDEIRKCGSFVRVVLVVQAPSDPYSMIFDQQCVDVAVERTDSQSADFVQSDENLYSQLILVLDASPRLSRLPRKYDVHRRSLWFRSEY